MTKILTKKISKKKVQTNPLNIMEFFGKGKGIFGDGLKYQKSLRKEWK